MQTLARLLPLLPQTTENTLILIVETVEATLRVGGQALDAASCKSMVDTVLTTWFEKPQGTLAFFLPQALLISL